jgi:large subunit ribosomal protein L20
MSRVTRGFKARRRRNKVLKMAKGYRGAKHRLYRTVTEAVDRALCFAYRDRRTKKRNFRNLWITRIAAAARMNGTSYSRLINGMKKADIVLDRKVLSNLAIVDPKAFSEVVKASGASS